MIQTRFQFIIATLLAVFSAIGVCTASPSTPALAQQPTADSTPGAGIFITVLYDEPQINIRMGPSSTIYPIVGTMVSGASAPALGRSPGGDWIQIEFPSAPGGKGWVYSPLVQLSPGTLQVVEPPPTPVPPSTSTVDPTLAAQFVVQPTNTRLPTFTPPPTLEIMPTFTQPSSFYTKDSVPLVVIIAALAVLGLIGFLLSFIIRR